MNAELTEMRTLQNTGKGVVSMGSGLEWTLWDECEEKSYKMGPEGAIIWMKTAPQKKVELLLGLGKMMAVTGSEDKAKMYVMSLRWSSNPA